eukprot:snap_masked-scaffold_32-processed-gene-2.41-mRNA-1 protein AED:1.00 eAED:1.00 QI:0/0/0/0/1/1/2/0/70
MISFMTLSKNRAGVLHQPIGLPFILDADRRVTRVNTSRLACSVGMKSNPLKTSNRGADVRGQAGSEKLES